MSKPSISTFMAPVNDTCDMESYQLCVLASDHEAARAADRARIAELEVLLSKCAPVLRAHAGASHMLEGFRPKRNQWDELVEAIDEAIAQQGKEGEC